MLLQIKIRKLNVYTISYRKKTSILFPDNHEFILKIFLSLLFYTYLQTDYKQLKSLEIIDLMNKDYWIEIVGNFIKIKLNHLLCHKYEHNSVVMKFPYFSRVVKVCYVPELGLNLQVQPLLFPYSPG